MTTEKPRTVVIVQVPETQLWNVVVNGVTLVEGATKERALAIARSMTKEA